MKKPLIIALCAVVAVPVVFVASFTYGCDQAKKGLVQEKQALIDNIDIIALLGENPAQKAEVEAFSRCGQLTGSNFVSIQKNYSTTMNGGQAVDAIRASLASAGYTITSEYFGVNWGCKLTYDGRASKDGVKIGFGATQKNLKDPNCKNENDFNKTTEAYFRAQNIDSAHLNIF